MGEIFSWTKPRNALQFTGERWTSAARGQIEVEHLHRYLAARDFCRGKDVLDIACGEGYGSVMLAQVARRVVGVDLDRAAIAHAAAEYPCANLHYVAGDARRIPLATGSLDVAVSFETLEHFAEQEAFLAELARVLRPNGVLLISTPDCDVYSPIGGPANHYHVRELSREEFAAALSAHFSHIAILGQRALTGSAIIPRAAGVPGLAPVTYERRDEEHFERSSGLPRPVYLIACASNRALAGRLGPSLYVHAGQVENPEAVRAELRDAEAGMQALRQELEQLRADRASEQAEMRALAGELETVQAELNESRSALKIVRAELAQARSTEIVAANLRSQNLRLAQTLTVNSARLRSIEESTSWRATAVLRSALSRLPAPVRRNLRRGAKAAYWVLTPHRTPERIRFVRERRRSMAGRTEAGKHSPSSGEHPLDLSEAPVPESEQRSERADIVVCVHNALDDVRRSLTAVLEHTYPPYRIILVDDGSAAPTRDYLADFAAAHDCVLLRNEKPLGYAAAANCGIRASDAPWIVLLNSDTVVTQGWLDAMWLHGWRDPLIGIIGPLSNSASWQSVPKVAEGDDWARNELPPEVTVDDMAEIVRGSSVGPRFVPFLNGFCYMVRRRLIDRIGMFDDQTFPNYGEENDFSIRARRAGYKLVVATDAYVFHAGSKSYSLERRRELERRANAALAIKHEPDLDIDPHVRYCQSSLVLVSVRARVQSAMQRRELVSRGRKNFFGKRIAFILPVSCYGGGANVIFQESMALVAMGVEVSILNFWQNHELIAKQGLPEGLRHVNFEDEAALRQHLEGTPLPYDAVIATYYKSVYWLPEKPPDGTVFGYYIQDFEPRFFAKGGPEHAQAKASYRKPSVKLFTKTLWNQNAVAKTVRRVPAVVGCSVNFNLFAPDEGRALGPSDRPLRIVAMLRPSSPYRAPRRTVDVLEEVLRRNPHGIAVHAFGATDADLQSAGLARPWITNYGLLSPVQVSKLLACSDIFVDYSDYQAMGLTLLEAMASGCGVVGPVEGGTNSFLCDNVSGLLADTSSKADCIEKTCRLVEDAPFRAELQRNAIEEASLHVPEAAALNILNVLFDQR